MLDARQGRLYRLLGQPLIGSRGMLDSWSISSTDDYKTSPSTAMTLSWYEVT